MPKVAISADFLAAFSRVPRAQQKKVREFTEKFRADPTMTSINYERLAQMRDNKVRRLAVTRHGKLIGQVTERRLLDSLLFISDLD